MLETEVADIDVGDPVLPYDLVSGEDCVLFIERGVLPVKLSEVDVTFRHG